MYVVYRLIARRFIGFVSLDPLPHRCQLGLEGGDLLAKFQNFTLPNLEERSVLKLNAN